MLNKFRATLHDQQKFPKRIILLGVSVSISVGLIIGFVVAHNQNPFTTDNAPPLIQADKEPFKLKPVEPGGKDIPFQALSLYQALNPNTQTPPQIEALATTEEEPKLEIIATPEMVQQEETPEAQASVEPEPTPEATSPAQDLNALIAEVAKEKPEPIANTHTASEKHVFIQVFSLPDQKSAESEWARIEKKLGDPVASLPHKIVTAHLSKGTYYRLVLGPVADTQSTEICNMLQQNKLSCLILSKQP